MVAGGAGATRAVLSPISGVHNCGHGHGALILITTGEDVHSAHAHAACRAGGRGHEACYSLSLSVDV